MNEQKYYVRLRNIVDSNQLDNWLINGAGTIHKLGTVRPSFSTNLGLPKISFTKSELAEVMNGGLYKEIKGLAEYEADTLVDSKTGWSYTDEIITDIEWINPLIELVPVKEEE